MPPQEGVGPFHTNKYMSQARQSIWSCIPGISKKIQFEALQNAHLAAFFDWRTIF